MIVKIFKISTKEMWTMYNKRGLIAFVKQETGFTISDKMTIKQIVKYLPVENYYRVK